MHSVVVKNHGLKSFGKPYDGLEDNDCGYATHCERRYIVTTRLPEKNPTASLSAIHIARFAGFHLDRAQVTALGM